MHRLVSCIAIVFLVMFIVMMVMGKKKEKSDDSNERKNGKDMVRSSYICLVISLLLFALSFYLYQTKKSEGESSESSSPRGSNYYSF